MTLSLIHHCTEHCRSGPPHNSCSFADALTSTKLQSLHLSFLPACNINFEGKRFTSLSNVSPPPQQVPWWNQCFSLHLAMLIMLCHISPEFYFLLCGFRTSSVANINFCFISHTSPEGNTIYSISLEMKLTSSTDILNTRISVVLTYLLHIQTQNGIFSYL